MSTKSLTITSFGLPRLGVSIVLSCLAWLLFTSPVGAYPTMPHVMDTRNYAYQVQSNGDISVVEHWQYTLQYTRDRLLLPLPHFIAQISLLYVTSIDVGTVNGSPYDHQIKSRITDTYGNPVEQVEWNAVSTAQMNLSYTLPYTLHGALGINQNSAWFDHVLFDPGSAFDGDSSLVTLTLPAAIAAKDVTFRAHYPGQSVTNSWIDGHTIKIVLVTPNNVNYLEILLVLPRNQMNTSLQKPSWQQSSLIPTLPTKTPKLNTVDPPPWTLIILASLILGFLLFFVLVYPAQADMLKRVKKSSPTALIRARMNVIINPYTHSHTRRHRIRRHS